MPPWCLTTCGNADCSLPWTSGVTGTLTFSGASPSTASQGFSIPAGPTNSTTVTMQYTGSGTGTVAMSAYSPTPSNTPKVFCGMGATPTGGGSCAITVTPPVDHFQVTTPASNGLTCESVTYTIKACSNATCSTVLTTGASGTLSLAGATPVNSAGFTTNASGIATVTVRTTTIGNVTASITGASPAPQNALRCGMGVSAGAGNSCVYEAKQSKFKFDVPHHVGGVVQSVVINAIKSSEDGSRCGAAFAATEKSVMFTCTAASHSGLTGSVALQGKGTGATAIPSPAALTVTALNNNAQVMTAFGNEVNNPARITVSKAGQSPTGADANVVAPSIAMNNMASGLATGTLRWAEVGTLSLAASLNAGSVYNNAGIPVSGSVSSVGPFIPHHFDVEVTQGSSDLCTQVFTYSGESFKTQVTAQNADGAKTVNYDGRSTMSAYFAKAVTLSGTSSTGSSGSLTGSAIAASDFAKGVATVRPVYAFSAKATAPASITVSAAENAPGTVNSSAGSAGVAKVRSGRLFLSNAFGSGRTILRVPAQLQYWSGKAWVLNGDDNCSVIPNNAVILARYSCHRH